jgi:hypothetical protein
LDVAVMAEAPAAAAPRGLAGRPALQDDVVELEDDGLGSGIDRQEGGSGSATPQAVEDDLADWADKPDADIPPGRQCEGVSTPRAAAPPTPLGGLDSLGPAAPTPLGAGIAPPTPGLEDVSGDEQPPMPPLPPPAHPPDPVADDLPPGLARPPSDQGPAGPAGPADCPDPAVDGHQPRLDDMIRGVYSGKIPMWGCFSFSSKKPASAPPHGGLEATCKYHAKNAKTKCKRMIRYATGDEAGVRQAMLTLQHWCNQAVCFTRQRQHVRMPLAWSDIPAAGIVHGQLLTQAPPLKAPCDD